MSNHAETFPETTQDTGRDAYLPPLLTLLAVLATTYVVDLTLVLTHAI